MGVAMTEGGFSVAMFELFFVGLLIWLVKTGAALRMMEWVFSFQF